MNIRYLKVKPHIYWLTVWLIIMNARTNWLRWVGWDDCRLSTKWVADERRLNITHSLSRIRYYLITKIIIRIWINVKNWMEQIEWILFDNSIHLFINSTNKVHKSIKIKKPKNLKKQNQINPYMYRRWIWLRKERGSLLFKMLTKSKKKKLFKNYLLLIRP